MKEYFNDKLKLTETEEKTFKTLKDNYNITIGLFLNKSNKKYIVKIDYFNNSNYLYTFKLSNKILKQSKNKEVILKAILKYYQLER